MFNYQDIEQADEGSYTLVTPISAARFMLPYWDLTRVTAHWPRSMTAAGEARGRILSSGLPTILSATGNTRLSRWLSPKPT